jgi:hypothetical protein
MLGHSAQQGIDGSYGDDKADNGFTTIDRFQHRQFSGDTLLL